MRSIIVQGNLQMDTWKFYKNFQKDSQLLFCTWEGLPVGFCAGDGSVIKRTKPKRFSLYSRDLELLTMSVLAGLERVDGDCVVVVRGDEWLSNLDRVFLEVERDAEKIFSIPIDFKSWDACPFHFSTHMIAGRKDRVKMMFDRCFMNMVTPVSIWDIGRPPPDASILAKGYMDFVVGDSENWKEDFRRSFGIVDLELLKYYKLVSEDSGREWYSNFDPNNDGSWDRSIASMEDL